MENDRPGPNPFRYLNVQKYAKVHTTTTPPTDPYHHPFPPATLRRDHLLAVAGLQQDLDADTALCADAVGEASLKHIVGGSGNLWARPFFCHDSDSGNSKEIDPFVAGGVLTAAEVGLAGEREGDVFSAPRMLLAARLQGAVAVGRGPAVARALTATVSPRGGEWMLPSAGPVQVRIYSCSQGIRIFCPP